ncbi:MAG: cyclic nucleotide-binding domain-containing protein [Rhodospirillaceae bacterium]|nr:cyclic nucleotide-binding domain-containing protein [Rhodospirillaceae bacterium]
MFQSLDGNAIEVANYPKGTPLFRQGELKNATSIVNDGSIGIYREIEEKRVSLATLRKGELSGEIVVIDGSHRMAPAFTLEGCTLTMISVEFMSENIKKTDPFIKAPTTMFLGNLRSVHKSYTPNERSLVDSVTTLSRQCDVPTIFLTDSEDVDLDVAVKVGELNEIVTERQNIADKNRDKDRRGGAMSPAGPPN